MRKNFKKVATVAIIAVATIVTAITFQSCSQETDSVSPSETKLTTEQAFANDLQRLANAQRKFAKQLTANAFSRRAGEVPTDSLGIPDDCQEAAQEVVEIIGEMAQNYDLTADLTAHEIEGLSLSEEDREIMALDSNALFDYIGDYKSKEFNAIVLSMFENPNYKPSIEEIIQNENLKMNEKINLVIKVATNDYITEDYLMEPELPMEPHGLMVSSCEEKLQDDYLDCAYQFTANLIGVVGDLIISGIKEARESYEKAQARLENCKNNADIEYKHCVNNRKK